MDIQSNKLRNKHMVSIIINILFQFCSLLNLKVCYVAIYVKFRVTKDDFSRKALCSELAANQAAPCISDVPTLTHCSSACVCLIKQFQALNKNTNFDPDSLSFW